MVRTTGLPPKHVQTSSPPNGAAGFGAVECRWPLALLGGQPLPGSDHPLHALVDCFGPSVDADLSTIPVVFLPGLIGLNEHFSPVVTRVCHRVPAICYQPPLLKVGGEMASTVGWARITAEFLRTFIRRPAIMVGSSFGGHVALRTAMLVPELVRGIVLTGSSGMGEKSVITDNTIKVDTDWCRRRIGELYFDQRHVQEAEINRAHKELTDRGNARVMIRLSKSARRDHLTDELHLVTAPTLLIWGKQDIVTPPAACRAFARCLPNTRTVWLDQCGHVPMVEHPQAFSDALLEFHDELVAAARG